MKRNDATANKGLCLRHTNQRFKRWTPHSEHHRTTTGTCSPTLKIRMGRTEYIPTTPLEHRGSPEYVPATPPSELLSSPEYIPAVWHGNRDYLEYVPIAANVMRKRVRGDPYPYQNMSVDDIMRMLEERLKGLQVQRPEPENIILGYCCVFRSFQ